MIDFMPFYQIIIGVYFSLCFEKLVSSLLWNDHFTQGLKTFYDNWNTLLLHDSVNPDSKVLEDGINETIQSYIQRTRKFGLFMLVSVSTIMIAYCWVGNHARHNELLLCVFSLWSIVFCVLIFIRPFWKSWKKVLICYLALIIVLFGGLFLLKKCEVEFSHRQITVMACINLIGISFPLIIELFRTQIRSLFFLKFLTFCRQRISQTWSSILQAILDGSYGESKYLLLQSHISHSNLKEGEIVHKDKLNASLIDKVRNDSEKAALKLFTNDVRTWRILACTLLSSHFQSCPIPNMNDANDIFNIKFTLSKNPQCV